MFTYLFNRSTPTHEVNRFKSRKLGDSNVDQQKDISKNPPSKFENNPEPEKGSSVCLAGSKTKKQPKTLMLKVLQSNTATVSDTVHTQSALSLLTTFLLKDKKHIEAHSSAKLVLEKPERRHTRIQKVN